MSERRPGRLTRRSHADERDRLLRPSDQAERPHYVGQDDPLSELEERAAPRERPTAPEWFRDMLEEGRSHEEVLKALLDRISDVNDLREAQAVVNEIGRLPTAGRLVRRYLTQDLLSRLQKEREANG